MATTSNMLGNKEQRGSHGDASADPMQDGPLVDEGSDFVLLQDSGFILERLVGLRADHSKGEERDEGIG